MVALVSFSTVVIFSIWGEGFSKLISFLQGIITGYTTEVLLNLIDFTAVVEVMVSGWIKVPEFMFPVQIAYFATYHIQLTGRSLAIIPIAFVTISEHIGAHSVLSKITGKDFAIDPGYARTLLGDGVASTVSCLIGGPEITTYSENTGVIGLSILVDEQVDFSQQRNVIIASTMIVLGLGGAVIQFGGGFMLEGMALAAILGIVLNLILPKEEKKEK